MKNELVMKGWLVPLYCNPLFLLLLILQMHQRQTHLICSVMYFEAEFLPHNMLIMDLYFEALEFVYLCFNAVYHILLDARLSSCRAVVAYVLLCLVNKMSPYR